MINSKIFYIFGPDGVGKTTHATLLANFLKSKGIKYKRVWIRFPHFISLPIAIYARLIHLSETIYVTKNVKIGYRYFYKSRLVKFFYPILFFIDVWLITMIKVYLPLLFGYSIICDRFIFDILVDIMIATREFDFYKSRLGLLFKNLIPSHAKIVGLYADKNVLRMRRKDVEFDKTISLKIALYKKIAKEYGIPTINSKFDKYTTFQKILNTFLIPLKIQNKNDLGG